ncbi:unnamed protein product [Colias eurytheme]|nr:unnamed protein product [Colias eurytheme]
MKYFIVLSALVALSTAAPVELTLQQIDSALSNPHTDPALIPVLEAALNEIMEALFAGHQVETVTVDLPLEAVPGIVNPAPAPVPSPSPAPSPASSSPLVQVVVNVNKQTQQIHEIPAFVPGGNPVNVIAVNPIA